MGQTLVKIHSGSQHRTLFVSILLVWLCSLTFATTAFADGTVIVNPSDQRQTVLGWGTSLCWWARVIGGFPKPARTEYIQEIFDPVKGLGLNIVRYNIGGGENPLYLAPNAQFLTYRTNIPGYELSPDVWNWNADADQRTVLKEAVAKGATVVQAFSNSPPYWMTVSGSVTGSRTPGQDNLDPAYNQEFADYLTTVANHFQKSYGITFASIEPLNEPDGRWWRFGGRQEGCYVDRTNANQILKLVGRSLKCKRVKTWLAASDDNSIDNAILSCNSWDPETLSYIKQIDTHAYSGTKRTQLKQLAISNGKILWMSEYGDGDNSGLTMSESILKDMNEMGATAWITWQAVDRGGWGLLSNPETDSTTTAFTVNEKYYVLGQYCKFIRPGSVIIGSTDAQSLAAWDPHRKSLIVVTTNSGTEEVTASYDLTRFVGLGTVTPFQTCAAPLESLSRHSSFAEETGRFTVTLPPKSVTTFVISGLKFAANRPAAIQSAL